LKSLGVCCASRVKPRKIADQAIFYPANSQSSPDNRGFYDFFDEKIIKTYRCDRLLGFIAFLALLLFLPAFTGTSQEGGVEGDELEISIVSSPDNPVTGGTWAVTILVEYPVPRDVTVKPPRFPPALILERVRTESRSLSRPGRSDEAGLPSEPARWTAVEFLFTLQEPGEIVLEPFEASAGGRRGVSREISVRVREAPGTPRHQAPVSRWQTPLPAFTVGQAAELRLSLRGWDKEEQKPAGFFKGKAPLNAILEELPPIGPLPGGEFIYPLRIIPLEETVVLDGFSFQWEGVGLTVPSLTIRARPGEAALSGAPALAAPSPEPASSEPALPQPETGNIPFPKTGGRIFPFFRSEYEQTAAELKALWEEGLRAQALAEIRRKERESWAGPEFAGLRREMEESLRLGPTADEKWRPRNARVFLFAGLFLFALAAVFLFRPRFSAGFSAGFSAVTSGKISGYKIRIILAAAVVFAVILLVEFSEFSGNGGRAVLEKTPVYRVPEKQGAVSAFFGEGQPVSAGVSRGEWVYVESADGRAGWVPAAAVIWY
jgi:hypothetical protein